jgi:hypothetical protein
MIWIAHCLVLCLNPLRVLAHTQLPENAAELAVSAAFDSQGSLWIVGSNGPGELYLQRVLEQGKRLNESKRIIKLSGDKVSASGENRPKIKFGPQGQLLISYTKPLSRPYTGEVRMIRSSDGGLSFSQPFTVHQDRQEITHRFESMIFDHQGVLHTFWIDKRDQELIRRSKKLNHRDLASYYRGAAIYRNESNDAGLTFGPDIKVADHSCECCRIALTLDHEGKPVAMWRHVFEPNVRDHALWRFAAPERMQRASEDHWPLDACPHHGPAIAQASDGGFHALWYGERKGRAAVRYGRLNAEGSAIGTPLELPDANAEHADVFRQDAMLYVTWQFFDGKRSVWKVWLSHDEGRRFNARVLGMHAGKHDYPLIVGSPNHGVWGIWNTDQGLRLLRLDP